MVERWNGGTVERWNGGTVKRWNGKTVERWNGGTVEWNALEQTRMAVVCSSNILITYGLF